MKTVFLPTRTDAVGIQANFPDDDYNVGSNVQCKIPKSLWTKQCENFLVAYTKNL